MLFVSTPARWLALLACLCLATLTHANDDSSDQSVTYEKDIRHSVVAADGSYTFTREVTLRINEERAIATYAQPPLPYNRTQETLDILQAYTLKPDGSRLTVGPEQIREQQEPNSAQAPMFHDSVMKVLIFPQVAVGDRLVLSYKKQRRVALFPGQFQDLSFPQPHPTQQLTLIYDLPAEVALNVEAKGFKATPPRTEKGRTRYQWDYQPSPWPRAEPGAVDYSDYGQYLAVSTFSDYASFARAYAQRAQVQASPDVEKLAHSLTATLHDPREKALALADWVRRNIRYVAVYIGSGSVVPHAADTVLSNRYGDCKDHVALLQALLKAVKIDSSPALVNLGRAYKLPTVPTLGVLNHAITYIPSLDLYLDATDPGIQPGYLPVLELDKPTVIATSGTLGRTPAVQQNSVRNVTTFRIDADGGARFEQDSTVKGSYAEYNRWGLGRMQANERDLIVQRMLAIYGQTGSGTVKVELTGSGDELTTQLVGQTQNMVNLPGPIGMPTLTSFVGGITQHMSSFVTEKQRTHSFTCISASSDEVARFEFPAQVQILAVPKAVKINGGGFDYSADYTREGNTVVVKRSYALRQPTAVCSPEMFQAMWPALEAMLKDLNSQVIVEKS